MNERTNKRDRNSIFGNKSKTIRFQVNPPHILCTGSNVSCFPPELFFRILQSQFSWSRIWKPNRFMYKRTFQLRDSSRGPFWDFYWDIVQQSFDSRTWFHLNIQTWSRSYLIQIPRFNTGKLGDFFKGTIVSRHVFLFGRASKAIFELGDKCWYLFG